MKYYAVRKGRVPGIYLDWDKCRAQVDGFKGAEFKSFSTEVDAKNYLRPVVPEALKPASTGHDVIAYVDGSCLPDGSAYSSGIVILDPNGCIKLLDSFSGNDPEYTSMRNVAGEVLAASYAIDYALKNHLTKLMICYDYQGIEKWCTESWTARKPATQRYRDLYISAMMTSVWIDFTKIKSHSNDFWNDMADQMAKLALGMVTREEVIYSLVNGLYNMYRPRTYQDLSDLLLTKAAGYIMNTKLKSGYLVIEDNTGIEITYTIKEG